MHKRHLKPGTLIPHPWLPIAITCGLLVFMPLACAPPSPVPEATAPVPTTDGAPATDEAAPTSALPRPADPADYVPTIQQILAAGGDAAAVESLLASWDALPETPSQVIAADLTGDGAQEIVVALRYAGDAAPPPGDLLIFAQDHTLLYQEGYTPRGAATRLLQVMDVNQDANPDIVYVLITCGAHTCFESLKILQWRETGLASLMGGRLDMPYPTYTVTPGRIDAQSGLIGSIGAEPQRGYSETWELHSGVFTVTEQIWQPPVYRYHALLDGDRALFAGDYAAAIAAYERVLGDDALQEWGAVSGAAEPAVERAQLAAFARWRTALTYLLADDPENAQAQHSYLQTDYPSGSTGHNVVALAEVFWTAYAADASINIACSAMVKAAKTDTSVHDFFNETYGYANPRWEATDLCPFIE